jgi:ABC-type Zn2+ transport system substrate-binding protein/surface adhesin
LCFCQSQLKLKMRLINSITLSLTFFSYLTFTVQAEINVVASVKPLHSLVAGVMEGVKKPDLIVKGAVSPHTYSLKPSQAKQLEEADLVFWMGHELESFLEQPLEAIATKAKVIELMDSQGLKKMEMREGGAFDDHGHEEHGEHSDEKHDEHTGEEHGKNSDEGHDKHLGEGHTFEWAGTFKLFAGDYIWTFSKVGGKYADPKMKMVFLPTSSDGEKGIEDQEEAAEKLLQLQSSLRRDHGSKLSPNKDNAYQLAFDQNRNVTEFRITIEKDGFYVFFTEHMPFEFEANEHFLKNIAGNDIESIVQEPEAGHHDHHGHGEFDVHVWLDPENAKVMVQEIKEALVKLDPDNAGNYETNAKNLMTKLNRLIAEISAKLASSKGKGFVVFHDAYQYFEERFGMMAVGSITVSPEVAPGANRIRELKDKINELNAHCVFSEPQFQPKIVFTVAEGTDANTGVLDPLGASITDGPELYFTLIRNMASNLEECLSKKG